MNRPCIVSVHPLLGIGRSEESTNLCIILGEGIESWSAVRNKAKMALWSLCVGLEEK